jgi:Xaa-Pro aminopeptidase
MNISARLDALRAVMKSASVSAYIVPSADPHQSEYPPACWKRREFITGFDGSAGDAVVTLDGAGLWTDGRYWTQAEAQLKGSGVELFRSGAPGVPSWQAWLGKLPEGTRVGVDPRTVTKAIFDSLQADLARRGVALVPVEDNLIDRVWSGRPEMPKAPVRAHPAEFAGKSAAQKIEELREEMRKAGATAHAVTALDCVAWLFNLRGGDVECNPLFVAHAVVTLREATLFIDASRMGEDARRAVEGVAQVRPYEEFDSALRALAAQGERFWLDEQATGAHVFDLAQGRVVERSRSPVFLAKGIKNEAELRGMRDAHRRDGAAMVRFLKWLEDAVPLGGQTETSIARTLQAMRAQDERSVGVAFESIVGFGPNGAIVHYRPTERSSLSVTTQDVLLIDSGGQYVDGTTDITRTVHLGRPTDEHRARFTAVLKAHIALATQRFPRGARGVALDAVARSRMWNEGLDYQHGTGHGVGAALSVHEEPPRINGVQSGFLPLHPGMIFSNEPGYYAVGRYGIRIENLEEIVADDRPAEGGGGFLRLRPLTLCPIQLTMIEPSMLDEGEVAWLDDYHARVRRELTPLLDAEHGAWLNEQTRPLREIARG